MKRMFSLQDAIDYIEKEAFYYGQAEHTNDVNTNIIVELNAITRYLKAKEAENKKSNMYDIIKQYERKY